MSVSDAQTAWKLPQITVAVVLPRKTKKSVETVPVSFAERLSFAVPECAALMDLKVCTLRQIIWAGELSCVPIGLTTNKRNGRYLIRREALERFLKEHEEWKA